MARRLEALQPAGIFVLRLALGGIVLAYSVTRFASGMGAFTAVVVSAGLPRWMSPVAAGIELLAALMLIIGLKARAAAAAILVYTLVGLRLHFQQGFFAYDAYLAHAAMALVLIFFGAGPWSVDSKVRPEYGRRK